MKLLSSLKLRIVYNTLAQIIGKIITGGANFFITVLIAQQFGASGLGDFSKIFSFVAIFYLIADFGLNAVYVRESQGGRGRRGDRGELFNALLGLRFFGALLLIFIALAITSFLPFNSRTGLGFSPLVRFGIIIGSLTILTQALFTSFNARFQQQLRYDKSVTAAILGTLVILGLIWWLIRAGGGLLTMVGSYVIGGLVMVLVSIWLSRWPVLQLRLNELISIVRWQRLFYQAWPLGLTLIFNVVYIRSDVLLLSIYRPSSEVGFYSLAVKALDFLLVIPTFLMNAIYPIMVSRFKQQQFKPLRRLVKIIGIILLNCSIVILLLSWYLAPALKLVKVEFGQSILLLRILALGLPFFYLSSLLMWLLIVLKKQKLLLAIYGFGLLFNIVANLIFIPVFGALAAATITGISEGVILGLSGYYGLRLLAAP